MKKDFKKDRNLLTKRDRNPLKQGLNKKDRNPLKQGTGRNPSKQGLKKKDRIPPKRTDEKPSARKLLLPRIQPKGEFASFQQRTLRRGTGR